jgi:formylglycine-generating enzyme required for sulfatase activity
MQAGGIFRDCPDCPELVVIPAGHFIMGSPSGETGRQANEGPQHEVNVGGFALSKTEVTRGQFAAFVNDTGYSTGYNCRTFEGGINKDRSGRDWRNPGYSQEDNHPVVCVNWQDAHAYAQWLSRKTDRIYRLPTEAEWEYAARAGTVTAHYWGETSSQACVYANVMDSSGKSQFEGVPLEVHNCTDGYAYTSPVASFTENAFGLYDMIGNVWEWVEDCWNDNYSGAPTDGAAWMGGSCSERVQRGNSWQHKISSTRTAYRLRNPAAMRDDDVGFRLVRTE